MAKKPQATKAKAQATSTAAGEDSPEPKVTEAAKKAPFIIETSTARSPYLNLLVYGEYGVGKTRLTASATAVDAMNDILMINAEAGDLTLHNDPDIDFSGIDAVTVQDYATCSKIYDYLRLHCQWRDDPSKEATEKLLRLERQLKNDPSIKTPRRYRTVIIDSLTEVETYCMYQLLGVRADTKLDEEVAGAEWGDYKKQLGMIQRLLRNFRNLPMHFLCTCSRRYVQDEQKRFNFSPSMTGQLAGAVQGFMDMVGYLVLGAAGEDGEIPRRLMVQPVGRFAAKNRFASFRGTHFDDPTIGSILDAVGLLPKRHGKGV